MSRVRARKEKTVLGESTRKTSQPSTQKQILTVQSVRQESRSIIDELPLTLNTSQGTMKL